MLNPKYHTVDTCLSETLLSDKCNILPQKGILLGPNEYASGFWNTQFQLVSD